MSHVQCAIIQPYVRFDGDCADGKSAVKGDIAPVVIMAVDRFWDDALGETGGVDV